MSCQTGLARATWACKTPKRPCSLFRSKGRWLASRPLFPFVKRMPKAFLSIRSWSTSGFFSSKCAGTYIWVPQDAAEIHTDSAFCDLSRQMLEGFGDLPPSRIGQPKNRAGWLGAAYVEHLRE